MGRSRPPAHAPLPHFLPFADDPIVFLTTCVAKRRHLLAQTESHVILHDIWEKSAAMNGWFVGRYLLMPDHVHFFAARAPTARPLADWMRLWKSISAARINRTQQRTGPFWQADYFDRFIRSRADYEEKLAYVALNPVRIGLVDKPAAWPFGGVIHDLRHHASRG